MRVLIVGCGYIGIPLGNALSRAGHDVLGLRRSPAMKSELAAAGIRLVVGDVTDPSSLMELPGPFDWVVHCVSAGGGGPDGYRAVYVDGTRNLIHRLAQKYPRKFIYTSSTSVYGQNDGSWVTEASETNPGAETGKILLQAEQQVLEEHGRSGFPGLILRLAGIYGPKRDYWRRQFLERNGALDGDGSRWLNMIHLGDVVRAVTTALEQGVAGEVYNVVDDEPVTQRTLYTWLAGKLGTPAPTPSDTQSFPRKRGLTSKRISNRKLRENLGYTMQYPTFREGFETF